MHILRLYFVHHPKLRLKKCIMGRPGYLLLTHSINNWNWSIDVMNVTEYLAIILFSVALAVVNIWEVRCKGIKVISHYFPLQFLFLSSFFSSSASLNIWFDFLSLWQLWIWEVQCKGKKMISHYFPNEFLFSLFFPFSYFFRTFNFTDGKN